LSFAFKLTAKKQTVAVIAPIKIAAIGLTNPAAGVIPISPATAPVAIPTAVGLPHSTHSQSVLHASLKSLYSLGKSWSEEINRNCQSILHSKNAIRTSKN
jgi:hypothetical protein